MKILFLPNWTIKMSDKNVEILQSPDKYIKNEKYWFFRYFPEDTQVDIVDIHAKNILHRVEVKIKFYIWQSILAFLKSRRYDVVVSHGAQSGLVYALLQTLFFRKKPEHIIFDIGGMNGAKEGGMGNKLIAFALKSKPRIICHSRIIVENYKKTYPGLVPLTTFIPFGVNPKEFEPEGNHQAGDYVFSFGYAKRDYDTLLKAWKSMDKRNHQLRIAGIKAHSLHTDGDTVELLGKVSIDELKKLISHSKFVVIPLPVFNYSYGQMSFLQSMCLGKTVIVTRTPSSIDYIDDGNGAFFVEPYDADDLKNKMEMLLSDDDLLKENNNKAHAYVLKYFSEEEMGKAIYNCIKNSLLSSL
jgi:glycosyltransferase involved in cell wall biosynthesis